jgi:hypothetical protein
MVAAPDSSTSISRPIASEQLRHWLPASSVVVTQLALKETKLMLLGQCKDF